MAAADAKGCANVPLRTPLGREHASGHVGSTADAHGRATTRRRTQGDARVRNVDAGAIAGWSGAV